MFINDEDKNDHFYAHVWIAVDQEWHTASTLTATVYWIATETDGPVIMWIGADGLASGQATGTGDNKVLSPTTPNAANTIISTSANITQFLTAGDEIMNIVVSRYQVSGGTAVDDTNTGDVHVLGVKVEAN